MVDIIIINGSPRKKENCANIVNDITDKLKNYNISYKVCNVYDMNINYCDACGFCNHKGYCKYKDDMTPLYKEFDNSKGCIVVSPVYFDSISAKLKTLVDRTQAIYASKYVLNNSIIDRSKKRCGMYIAVGGSTPYETQFMGGNIVMDFFFRCINTKLNYKYCINNSDKVNYIQSEEHKLKINDIIDKYIKEIEKN